jgi:hypothetical protein
VLALASSLHVDWCSLQPLCNFTMDVCLDTGGTTFTRPLSAFMFSGDDSCIEGLQLTLMRVVARYANILPG